MKNAALQRILVCIDRSGYDERCATQALAVARCLGGAITLLHVQPVNRQRLSAATSALDWELGRQEATLYLDRLRDEMRRSAACSITVRVEQGDPADRITAVAREINADLTVLGERGKGQTESSGLGSTAQQILAFAHNSVLVLRSAPARPGLDRILVPLDGSVRAESVLPTAQRIAREHHAEVLLAFIVAEPVATAILSEPADLAVAQDLASRLEKSGYRYLERLEKQVMLDDVSSRIAVLRAVDIRSALVDLSVAEHVGLIVLSAHGVTCNPELNSGSVAMSLLHRASAPLLLLQDLHGTELHLSAASPPAPSARATYAPEA